MSTFVKSLQRLYKNGRITKEKVESYKESGKITEEEYAFIIGE